jgi:hypothetical protein
VLHRQWSRMRSTQKQQALEDIKNILRQWPETTALLQLAEDSGIPVVFDKALIGKQAKGGFIRSTKPGRSRIRLQPLRPPEQLAATLVHELRHLWQADVMGIDRKDFRREYQTPEMKLLTTRIKEADAYAFTYMIAKRIERQEAAARGKKIVADDPAADAKNMRQRFLKELRDMDSYDRNGVRKYHELFTTAAGTPKQKKPDKKGTYAIENLRKILRAGVTADALDYLPDMTDDALRARVLRPVSTDVKKTMRLIASFEKAAASKKISRAKNLQRREAIAEQVAANMSALQKKQLEKPVFK